MKKYTIVTPAYTCTFLFDSPSDGGFFPLTDAGPPAKDKDGNPVVAWMTAEITMDDSARLWLMFTEFMGKLGKQYTLRDYKRFLTRHVALPFSLADALVNLKQIH